MLKLVVGVLANLSGCCHFTFGLQATNLALWSLFGKDSCAQQQPLHEAAVRLLLLPPSWPKPRQFQIGLTNPADRKGVYKPSLPRSWSCGSCGTSTTNIAGASATHIAGALCPEPTAWTAFDLVGRGRLVKKWVGDTSMSAQGSAHLVGARCR